LSETRFRLGGRPRVISTVEDPVAVRGILAANG
jgi:hypothetical protein